MNPLVFLVTALFDIYIVILLLRFLLQQLGADFYNPVSQLIVKVTQQPVFIARRIIPSLRGMDLATLVLVLIFIIIKIFLISMLQGYYSSSIGIIEVDSIVTTLILGMFELVTLTINVLIFSVFVQVILSWLNPDPYNPVISILNSLTAPILRPARKLIPPTGGFDFSPIVALIGMTFIKLVIIYIFKILWASVL
jgi:YggT family protein